MGEGLVGQRGNAGPRKKWRLISKWLHARCFAKQKERMSQESISNEAAVPAIREFWKNKKSK